MREFFQGWRRQISDDSTRLIRLANLSLATTSLVCTAMLLASYWHALRHNPHLISRWRPSMMLYWDIHRILQPIQQFAIVAEVVAAYANRNPTWRWVFMTCALLGVSAVYSGCR